MHAFLLETSKNPHNIDIKSILPEPFEKNIYYEIATIAEVREFKKSWVYSPHQKTLCVISQIDNAKDEAQNAILKILEEPPHTNLMFLLVVANASRLIPTILSRVAVLRQQKEQAEQKKDITITFELISKITDRDEAIELLKNKKSEAALKTIEALKKNGNVTLQLTNFLLNNTP